MGEPRSGHGNQLYNSVLRDMPKMSLRFRLSCGASALLMLALGVGGSRPTTLAAAVPGNTELQHEQHNQLDQLHIHQDWWTRAKDSNTLLAYAIRNTQNN